MYVLFVAGTPPPILMMFPPVAYNKDLICFYFLNAVHFSFRLELLHLFLLIVLTWLHFHMLWIFS